MLKSKFIALPALCFVIGFLLAASFPDNPDPALFFPVAGLILVAVSWRDMHDGIS